MQQASERKVDIPDFHLQRYVIAFLKDDKDGMERETANAQGKPEVDDWMSNAQGFVLAYSGHLEQARKMSRHAADLARRSGRRETEALYEADDAVREALSGNASSARQKARNALEHSRGRDGEYRAACALELSRDSSRSRMLIDDLSRRFPEDTIVQFKYLPTLRALQALNRNESAEALALLQTADPYEDGTPFEGGSDFLMGVGNFYPAYVRAMAYLMAPRGREAAAQFQKILDHRGIVISDPIGAMARIQLGRAYSLAGDREKARTAYGDFFKLWKDADHDIPIFKQAKAEYAKLQ